MTKTLFLLKYFFDCEIIETNMNQNRDTEHNIRHRFKEEIIVPYVAITNNIDFLMCRGQKKVHLTDGVTCIVTDWKEIHLFEMDDDVKRLYDMSAWDFAKRWYSYDKYMQSMTFVKIKLKKI